jgi:predicted nucleic acid-binding protein
MITAVDTNIILDVLIPDDPFGQSSKLLLDRHLSEGKLILCEVVFAELAAHFPSEVELNKFLAETGMRLVSSSEKSLYIAGNRWKEYSKKSNKNQFSCSTCGSVFAATCPKCKAAATRRFHVLADFLVGAHALVHADCMLSRDLGVYKTYFKDLKVVNSV